jgi:hypothetical protein
VRELVVAEGVRGSLVSIVRLNEVRVGGEDRQTGGELRALELEAVSLNVVNELWK